MRSVNRTCHGEEEVASNFRYVFPAAYKINFAPKRFSVMSKLFIVYSCIYIVIYWDLHDLIYNFLSVNFTTKCEGFKLRRVCYLILIYRVIKDNQ